MIESVAEFVFHTIGCLLLVGTGEAILYAVTLGRYHPIGISTRSATSVCPYLRSRRAFGLVRRSGLW